MRTDTVCLIVLLMVGLTIEINLSLKTEWFALKELRLSLGKIPKLPTIKSLQIIIGNPNYKTRKRGKLKERGKPNMQFANRFAFSHCREIERSGSGFCHVCTKIHSFYIH